MMNVNIVTYSAVSSTVYHCNTKTISASVLSILGLASKVGGFVPKCFARLSC